MVRDHLRHRPVKFFEISLAQAEWRDPARAHLCTGNLHFEREIDGASRPILRRIEIRQRRGVALRTHKERCAIRSERFHWYHPRRDAGCEALAQKRAERLVFPGLYIAGRPVVDQADAEDVILGGLDGDRLSQRVARPDEEADFEFVIQRARRAERRGLRLSVRPSNRRAAHDDRRRPPVIADGNVLIVRQQRIVRTEELADIGGVENRGVEIGIVANRDRQKHLGIPHGHETRLSVGALDEFLQSLAQCVPVKRSQRHQGVDCVGRAGRAGFRR